MIQTAPNGIYTKVEVQWLNEALCVIKVSANFIYFSLARIKS